MEYGVTDRLTLMLQGGLQHIDIAAPVDASRTGLDYTQLGARYQLFQAGGWVLSGQAVIQIPGTSDTSNPAAIGYTDFEGDFRALLGKSFTLGAMPAFVDFEVAQRQRGDGAPNEFRADGTLGVQVLPRWLILAQSFNVLSEGARSPVFGSYDYEKFRRLSRTRQKENNALYRIRQADAKAPFRGLVGGAFVLVALMLVGIVPCRASGKIAPKFGRFQGVHELIVHKTILAFMPLIHGVVFETAFNDNVSDSIDNRLFDELRSNEDARRGAINGTGKEHGHVSGLIGDGAIIGSILKAID